MTTDSASVSFGVNPFELKKNDGYISLKINGAADPEVSKTLDIELKKHLQVEPFHLLVNLESCTELPKTWIRTLIQLSVQLKGSKKQIRFINVKDKLIQDFKIHGVDSAFKISTSLQQALFDFTQK